MIAHDPESDYSSTGIANGVVQQYLSRQCLGGDGESVVYLDDRSLPVYKTFLRNPERMYAIPRFGNTDELRRLPVELLWSDRLENGWACFAPAEMSQKEADMACSVAARVTEK